MMIGICITFGFVLNSMSQAELIALFIYGGGGLSASAVDSCMAALRLDYYIIIAAAAVASVLSAFIPGDFRPLVGGGSAAASPSKKLPAAPSTRTAGNVRRPFFFSTVKPGVESLAPAASSSGDAGAVEGQQQHGGTAGVGRGAAPPLTIRAPGAHAPHSTSSGAAHNSAATVGGGGVVGATTAAGMLAASPSTDSLIRAPAGASGSSISLLSSHSLAVPASSTTRGTASDADDAAADDEDEPVSGLDVTIDVRLNGEAQKQ